MKQRTKPCKECPFSRTNILKGENPGGSPPFVYIGQSQGPFWLPCHMEKAYEGKETEPKAVSQCAGAAIYRANLGIAERMPAQMLRLPEDKEAVFASHAEFLAHYQGVPVEMAADFIQSFNIENMTLATELNKAEVKKVDL